MNKEGFTDKAFPRFYQQPEHQEMLKYFQIAKGLANGFKHFESPLPGQTHTGPRVVTSTRTRLLVSVSEEFVPPLWR